MPTSSLAPWIIVNKHATRTPPQHQRLGNEMRQFACNSLFELNATPSENLSCVWYLKCCTIFLHQEVEICLDLTWSSAGRMYNLYNLWSLRTEPSAARNSFAPHIGLSSSWNPASGALLNLGDSYCGITMRAEHSPCMDPVRPHRIYCQERSEPRKTLFLSL